MLRLLLPVKRLTFQPVRFRAMVGGGGQIVSVNSTNQQTQLLKATGIFEGTSFVTKLVKKGITLEHLRKWDRNELIRQTKMLQKKPLTDKRIDLIYSRLVRWKEEESQVMNMDLSARFNQSSINESLKKEIKVLDDYAEAHGFDFDRVRKTVEFGDKERKESMGEAQRIAGSIDLKSLVKGTKLGKEYEDEQRKDFEREQEKFKRTQEGYKVNKKVQEEWVEKSKIMQEQSRKQDELNKRGEASNQKAPKKRGRPKKVKA